MLVIFTERQGDVIRIISAWEATKKEKQFYAKNNQRTNAIADAPELTAAELKRARRVTPKETEDFRRAIEDKLGVSRPPRMGRPPKHPSERYVPISWRTPQEAIEWLVAQAHHAGLGKYQTFLSLLLRGMMRYEVVREKNGITLKLPNSENVIVIASEESLNRAAHTQRA